MNNGDDSPFLLPLVGARLVRVLDEFALVLVFADETKIRIEVPFRSRQDGNERVHDPQDESDDLADFQSLVGSVVSEAVASREGALRLVLDDSAVIEVDPSEGYEAWEFVGLDGLLLVAMGDRHLSVWLPDENV